MSSPFGRTLRSLNSDRSRGSLIGLAAAILFLGLWLAWFFAGSLKVVASFPPSDALARIRAGQGGELRLDGFPWAEYGSLTATVLWVADEAREGRVWVDCSVVRVTGSLIPLQHGLPGTLVIEVERLSPAEMVLRAAGRAVTNAAGRASGR